MDEDTQQPGAPAENQGSEGQDGGDQSGEANTDTPTTGDDDQAQGGENQPAE